MKIEKLELIRMKKEKLELIRMKIEKEFVEIQFYKRVLTLELNILKVVNLAQSLNSTLNTFILFEFTGHT